MKHVHTTIILLATSLAGCASEHGPPAPITTTYMPPETDTLTMGDDGTSSGGSTSTTAGTSASTTTTTTTSATGADTTGEPPPDPCEGMGKYWCRGWVGGLYLAYGTGTNYQFDIGGVEEIECVDEGVGTFEIVLPFIGNNPELYNSEMAAMLCKSRCEELVSSGDLPSVDWPAIHPGNAVWEHTGDTGCVFIANNAGTMPVNTVEAGIPSGNIGAASGCAAIGGAGHPVVVYEGPPDPDECASAMACEGWDPDATTNVTHSYVARTFTHTTWVNDAFFWYLVDTSAAQLYDCDEGRWMQRFDVNGVESWKMEGLLAGEFLYALGFRTNDKTLKIKLSGTSTWYNLDSYAHMIDAFNAMNPGSSYVLQFCRPNPTTGACVTHTMNLTIN
jgi:hypothetical protein